MSFVVAAPKNNEGEVIPIDIYPPMYVFYPVDNDISPIPLLLHAEFLVRSDRTEISKIKEGSFNSWVAKELAKAVIKFVAATYQKANPSFFLRLLKPFEVLENKQTSENTLLSYDEVATQLSLSTRGIRRLVASEDLPAPVKIGGSVRFYKSEIIA
ncbi:helix-turn-helix domain-containing protein, partial [Patescibacteria group bacterium]|nr:helix-turn-helix domain-containing protein [Patescibacteria group bacterium]